MALFKDVDSGYILVLNLYNSEEEHFIRFSETQKHFLYKHVKLKSKKSLQVCEETIEYRSLKEAVEKFIDVVSNNEWSYELKYNYDLIQPVKPTDDPKYIYHYSVKLYK